MISSLNNVLKSFKLKANCVAAHRHRHFVYFDVELQPGCRINKIMSLSREIAVAMRSSTEFSIKPIPEKGIIRLQTTVGKSDILKFSDLHKRNIRPDGFVQFLIGETVSSLTLLILPSSAPFII